MLELMGHIILAAAIGAGFAFGVWIVAWVMRDGTNE